MEQNYHQAVNWRKCSICASTTFLKHPEFIKNSCYRCTLIFFLTWKQRWLNPGRREEIQNIVLQTHDIGFWCYYWCQSLFSVMLQPSSTHTNILANVWILGITTIKRQRERFLTETLIPSGLYFSSWASRRWYWVTPTTRFRKCLTLYSAAAGRFPVSAAAIACCSQHSSLLGRSWYHCPKEHV